MVRGLCGLSSTLEEWELVALSALPMAYGIRAEEAFTAYYDGEEVVYTGAKGHCGHCLERCGAWMAVGAQHLRPLHAHHGAIRVLLAGGGGGGGGGIEPPKTWGGVGKGLN